MTARKSRISDMFAVRSEHAEQCALMKWWALECRRFCVFENLLFAIPNGGARSVVTGAALKAEGVRPGVPDLFLSVPAKGYSGLFIEMKKKSGGRPSAAQKQMKIFLERSGYCVKVCYGFDEAKKEIEIYLNSV